jgi:hypothetical protein
MELKLYLGCSGDDLGRFLAKDFRESDEAVDKNRPGVPRGILMTESFEEWLWRCRECITAHLLRLTLDLPAPDLERYALYPWGPYQGPPAAP